MSARSHITSHVLDAATGTPASGVPVTLSQRTRDGWQTLAEAVTDADGRVSQFGPESVPAGRYRVTFDTEAYFATRGQSAFYPEVQVVFELAEVDAHYHIALLLSPFAYSTYRGS
jgi:5-hydroxyisourate hydrolase